MTHLYGPKVHWIHEPISFGMLAELCQSKTFQPQINRIVELLYRQLITV
ncbi:MAG: uracil phosphoribosyltransferase, partial [Bdellovibrionia bacterium]